MPPSGPSLSYRDAGVDIDAGDRLVENIKPYAKRTMRPEVLAGIGGFGALVGLPKRYREPVLVAGTDGVGTKLKLAFALDKHDTIGIDLVAMSVNDILVQGAEPLFFLDYYVCERLDVPTATEVIKGIALGCELAGCALIGGETAEHPRAFTPGEYDLAGFAVGVVERSEAIDGTHIAAGDTLIGLASSGPHSNGFSLIRKIIETSGADLARTLPELPGRPTLGDALLEPTRIYVKPVLSLLREHPSQGNGAYHRRRTDREYAPHVLRQTCRAHRQQPLAAPADLRLAAAYRQRRGGRDASRVQLRHRLHSCRSRPSRRPAIARLTELGEPAYAIGTVVAAPRRRARHCRRVS